MADVFAVLCAAGGHSETGRCHMEWPRFLMLCSVLLPVILHVIRQTIIGV